MNAVQNIPTSQVDGFCVLSTSACVVGFDTILNILGMPDIVGTIRALEDISVPVHIEEDE